MHRFLIVLCTIVGALMFPWWVPLLFSVYGAIRFRWYLEALFAGLIIDSMYGTHALFGIFGTATLIALVLIVALMFFRRHIRYETFSS